MKLLTFEADGRSSFGMVRGDDVIDLGPRLPNVRGLIDLLDAEAWARAADAAGFTLFAKERPSERYLELLEMYSTMHEEGRPDAERSADETFTGKSLESHIRPIAELVRETGAKTILDLN